MLVPSPHEPLGCRWGGGWVRPGADFLGKRMKKGDSHGETAEINRYFIILYPFVWWDESSFADYFGVNSRVHQGL